MAKMCIGLFVVYLHFFLNQTLVNLQTKMTCNTVIK